MPTLQVQEICLSPMRKTCAGDLAHQVVRPGFDVARRAAFHQQHEGAIAEAADQIARLARLR